MWILLMKFIEFPVYQSAHTYGHICDTNARNSQSLNF